MSKLEEAIELCKDPSKYGEFNKGLKIFNKLITNNLLSINIRVRSLLELSKITIDEANDKIARIRDSISFLKDDELYNEIKMLSTLIEYPQINSHERLLCAVCIYNHNFIEMCYNLFSRLANDISVLINYRVEATRYLLYSEVSEYIKTAKKCLKSLIHSHDYSSEYRYNIIAGFITSTGLATILNREKLNVVYDEKFLYQLQKKFFWDIENGWRERILSGQHILDMKSVSQKIKDKIAQELLKIAKEVEIEDNPEETENIRADAAEVVLQRGNKEQRQEARSIIHNLGFLVGGDKRVKSLTEKQKTVYSDRQNVHDSSINRSVNEFIEKIVMKNEDKVDSYSNVHIEVTNLIYKSNLNPNKRKKAFKSLNRISIDTATFTDAKITVAELFVHIWQLMKKHEEDEFDILKTRLLEELIDMADTCSSGHAARLVNILSGYDVELKISWKDQIHANMAARMQKEIQSIEDEKLQEQVVLGMVDPDDSNAFGAFITFIEEHMPQLKKELYDEFVGDGYINEHDFECYFEEGTSEWVTT